MPRQMKESGVLWIGEMPKDWSLRRLRYLCDISTGNQDTQDNDPEGEYPFYVRSPIVEHSRKWTFEGPSILMAGDGAGAGKVFHYVNGKYGCHQRVYSMQNFVDANRRFVYYFMQNRFWVAIDLANSKSTVDSVRLPMLQDFWIPFPDINEQQKIADFLDEKCKYMDSVLEQTRASIEEYKKLRQAVIVKAVTKGVQGERLMKRSQIEWLDTIPENWSECRIKNAIFPTQKNIEPDDEIVTCFRDGEVTLRKNRREDGFTISFTEHGYHGVDVGDLVIHGMDAFAGAIGCSDSRGKTTPVVHVCSTIGNNRYFMYFLRCMAFGNILMDLSNGVRIRSSDYRNFAKLAVFSVAVPPIEEQNEIVDYLDQKIARIDDLIAKKEAFSAELENYKKSIIYEYVTGKKEVPQS